MPDNWNDYGYRTSFEAIMYLSAGHRVELGTVKVLDIGDSDRTELPGTFDSLSDDYCSLGSSLDYYEVLAEQPPTVYSKYLNAMNDVAYSEKIKMRFSQLEGFKVSLLRDPAAEEALRSAASLFKRESIKQDVRFSYVTPEGVELRLRYSSETLIPNRIHAVVGYNGAGKTRLLSDLAHVAAAGLDLRVDPAFVAKRGSIDPLNRRFSSVIAVSFSAFDTFDIPVMDDHPTDKEERYGYSYCGLRRPARHGGLSRDLRNEAERSRSLSKAIFEISTDKRRKTLDKCLLVLFDETSMRVNLPPDISNPTKLLDVEHSIFESLSSGHQIVIEIIVNLVAELRIGSLALIDEPESHLHPPLLAALMKTIIVALEDTDSFGMVATHSPIVLQEVPRTNVHILKRDGFYQTFSHPRQETFGENLDVITSEAFHLDDTASTYVGTLARLAASHSYGEIDRLFSTGLSRQADAVLRQLIARQRAEGI